MNNITVSLEMAKKLKEAGWKKETELKWYINRLFPAHLRFRNEVQREIDDTFLAYAPTAEEILRELPDHLLKNGIKRRITIDISDNRVDKNKYGIFYGSGGELYTVYGDTLANAAAQMYCHLSTNNLL